ncbi:TPA: DUF551 domain-containing protein [Enterobacter hormaechei subsp. steigerwaltii]
MSTITRELAKLFRKITNSEIDAEGNAHVVLSPADSLLINNARIALASLEAEAVHQVLTGDTWVDLSKGATDSQKRVDAIVRTLYTAPPAPVSVPTFDEWLEIRGNKPLGWVKDAMRESYDACRAAMLQGAEPVTKAYKLPDDFDFDRFNDVTWLDAVASNPHMHSLTTSTIAMVALELNKRLEAGNTPVIPDGWVACSERMPDPGSEFRVCAYTPTPHEDVRFRFVPASLFKSVCRDATHWQYMLPPAAPKSGDSNG